MAHHHIYNVENEKKTLVIIILTVITMSAEICYGLMTHSMALLADGYHMGTHTLAIGLAYTAYVLSRKFANSPNFPNGTEKIGTLAGYTSAICLAITGIFVMYEAVLRIIKPSNIVYNDAIIVAIIGFIINGLCLYIMERNGHDHINNEKDYNFLSAYYHILSDALTSILAILALVIGKYFNIIFLDSLVGILGGILILKWSISLIKNTVKILIDFSN